MKTYYNCKSEVYSTFYKDWWMKNTRIPTINFVSVKEKYKVETKVISWKQQSIDYTNHRIHLASLVNLFISNTF
jgi:hypothetical protein